jgi:predicted dehydrogenase
VKPRLGFVGLGWIGLDRLQSLRQHDVAQIVALCDPAPDALARAAAAAPEAEPVPDVDHLLALELDGIVVATPSALHAAQSIAALERGLAVFCQKPLGRDAVEVRAVVEAAERADRLLGVDLSYRTTRAFEAIHAALSEGRIGTVWAVDLTFHNAWGPDKPWYRDRASSGGGCLVDLGIHLVDAALWALGFPEVAEVRGRRWAAGERLRADAEVNEDHARAELVLAQGPVVHVACSWWLPAGRPAEIGADFWGTTGAMRLHNVDGSFFDFAVDECRGTERTRVVEPPDEWGGRALVRWAEQLGASPRFDPALRRQIQVAEVLDAIGR